MFCRTCGNRLEDDAKFCGVCGTRVINIPAPPEVKAPEPVEAYPAKPAAANPVEPAEEPSSVGHIYFSKGFKRTPAAPAEEKPAEREPAIRPEEYTIVMDAPPAPAALAEELVDFTPASSIDDTIIMDPFLSEEAAEDFAIPPVSEVEPVKVEEAPAFEEVPPAPVEEDPFFAAFPEEPVEEAPVFAEEPTEPVAEDPFFAEVPEEPVEAAPAFAEVPPSPTTSTSRRGSILRGGPRRASRTSTSLRRSSC